MNAIVLTGPESIELRDEAVPEPTANEVLVRVHAAGLCGSDAHMYRAAGGYEWLEYPRILGHEYSGTVCEVGADVTAFEPGDRVVEEPIHACGACFQCKNAQPTVCRNVSITGAHTDGAYREYVTVAPRHLHGIPDGLSLTHAAVAEPASIATRAVLTRSVTEPGDRVLVEGPGPIGVFVALVADAMGATVTVSGLEKDEAYRFPLLDDLGIDAVSVDGVAPETIVDDRTDGLGFDVVFDTTGHERGLELGVEFVRRGGQVVVAGLPGRPSELFVTPLVRGEIDVTTSYGSTWREFDRALDLLEQRASDVEALIDTSYDVERPERAFRDFLDSRTCKPVFEFHELSE